MLAVTYQGENERQRKKKWAGTHSTFPKKKVYLGSFWVSRCSRPKQRYRNEQKKSVPIFFFFNWEKLSLRGRRSKGKGKWIRARDHARGRREEGMSFHYFLRAPKFPLPLLSPTTQAWKKCDRAKFFLLIRPTEFFGCFRCLRRFTVVKRVKFAKVKRNTSKLRLLLSLSKV